MPSIHQDYEYDIFISYRQNDNRSSRQAGKRDGWVTNFVEALKDELEATIKNPVSIYFDENPHDGLLETHQVDASLTKKLKCLVFIPIISQTYCDTKSFAWEHEFIPFNQMAKEDELGMNITLPNGNVTSRVLPIKIHEIDAGDQKTLEKELNGPLRAIDFIYRETGVNRSLKPTDDKSDNHNKTSYHNQINKVANALKDIGISILNPPENSDKSPTLSRSAEQTTSKASTTLNKGKILIPLAVVILVALYFLISPYVFNKKTDKDISETGLAIMPLKNIANNADIDFLSFALKEETQDILSLSKQFGFLSSRMATAIYNNKAISPKEVGDELGVDYVLAGTYRLSGEQLKVSVELVDSHTGNSIWQESYDVEHAEENINPLQSKIAKQVLAYFNKTTDNNNLAQHAINFEAYAHYTKGLEWIQKRGEPIKAIAEFEQAVTLDPSHTQAWLQLIKYKSVLIFNNQQPFDKYQSELMEHLAVLSDAHPQWAADLANGIYQYHALSNYEKGFDYFKKVLDHRPNNEMANLFISFIYKRRLDNKQAYQHITKAIQLNPNNPLLWNNLAIQFQINGDYTREAKAMLRAVDLGIDSVYYYRLHRAYHWAGLQLDSIPTKNRDNNNKVVAMQNVFDSGDPNKVIEMASTIHKDSISGIDKYTYSEYYSDMARAYHALYSDDSARYYANLCVQEQLKRDGDEWYYLSSCYCILGDFDKSKEALAKYRSFDPEDRLLLTLQKTYDIYLLTLMKRYEEATKALIQFNMNFPNYGDYHLFYGLRFYRAKKEHPPFAEAVANLKLPPPLVEDSSLKRLDY